MMDTREKALIMLKQLAKTKQDKLRKAIVRKLSMEVLEEMVFYYADGKYVGYFSYIRLDRKNCESFVLVCLKKFGLHRSKAIEKVFYVFKGFQAFKQFDLEM